MTATVDTTSISPHLWQQANVMVDRRLPLWARRSNPVIRRHLGGHWRALPLETDLLGRVLLIQFAFIGLSVFFPIGLMLMFAMLPVSLALLPFAFGMYGRMLINIGKFTVSTIVSEQFNNTFVLLRLTPMSLAHILYSKAAAGVWRYVEDFGLIVMAGALLSVPVLALQYAAYWSFDDMVLTSRLMLALGLITTTLRLLLEPIMVASLAVVVGIGVPWRAPALLSLAAIGFFYFLLINLLRLVPMSSDMHFLVEIVLPVALPAAIIFVSFRLAEHILRRD